MKVTSYLKQYKLKANMQASSLMESVISISIITICLLVATMVYSRSVKQGNSVAFLTGKYRVAELLQKTKELKLYEDETYEGNGYVIEKKIVSDENSKKVKEVAFKVTANGRSTTFKYLIKASE